jgi:potassium-dependent mechanosensitive channel
MSFAMKQPIAPLPLPLPLLVCITALLACLAPAMAADAAKAASDKPAAVATAEDLRAQLEAAKKFAALIESSPNYAANAPASATEDELKARRFYARETVRSYETAMRNATRRDELRRSLEEAKRQDEQWTAVPGGPPYSVIVVDQLVHEAQAAQKNLEARKTRLELTRSMRDTLSQAIKDSAATVRQLEEQVPQAGGAQRMALEWRLELVRYLFRSQAAILKSLETAEDVAQLDIAVAESALGLIQRKVASVKGQAIFPESDFKRIKDELAAESAAVMSEMTRTVDAAAGAADKLEAARHALAQATAAVASTGDGTNMTAAAEGLRLNVLLAEIDAAAANTMLDALRFKPGAHELKRLVWDYRYRLYQARSPQLVAEIKAALADQSQKLQVLSRVAERRMAVLQGEITEIEQVMPAPAETDKRRLQTQLLTRNTERERALRQLAAFYSSTGSLLERLRDELQGDVEKSAPAERFATLAISGKQILANLWDFEIFAIEDTIEVDGRKVASLTSISVGKVVRAIAIFSAGVLLSFWLGRGAEVLVVRYFRYDAARARILRKWLFALGLIILLVVVLLWVNIPLTIFAFLGGAVAIGLGFGMQNMLKNLISGLMLLFERPFSPGDMIEVGNLKGKVLEIGIRSSAIRDANGIVSLIPNSTFVEQSVTNWTYDNPRVRFSIRVGVIYGSPVEEVARLLEACVTRHGLILKDPEPEVLLDKFGTGALEFAVYYWLEISSKLNRGRVASDLHFMIEKALSEAGISMTAPRQDVGLQTASPLRIQLVNDPPHPGE